VLKSVLSRVELMSDRLLERVVPKANADAQCGNWTYCCAYDPKDGRNHLGFWRRDVEHGAICTPCALTVDICWG
jgi:hypothetical protein